MLNPLSAHTPCLHSPLVRRGCSLMAIAIARAIWCCAMYTQSACERGGMRRAGQAAEADADSTQPVAMRFEYYNVSGGGSGATQGEGSRDVLVTPLATTARDGWFASSPSAAQLRQSCLAAPPPSPPASRRAARGHRRVASAADGGSMDWKAQGQCGRLQRDELGMDMFLSSAAPFLWSLADNDTSSSSLSPGAAWRGTRFLSIAGRSAMCHRSAADVTRSAADVTHVMDAAGGLQRLRLAATSSSSTL